MVKETFLNLPEEKRKKIIDTAIAEFASKPYTKASLTNIVAKAGIAKGSMYQYFDDKKDLYLYLVDVASDEKIRYIGNHVEPNTDFFNLLEQMIRAGISFGIENPLISKIVANSMSPFGEDVFQAVFADGRKKSIEYFKRLLIKAQTDGYVRADIDLELASNFLYSMLGIGLSDYIVGAIGISLKELASDSTKISALSSECIDRMIQEAMGFIRYGLGKR